VNYYCTIFDQHYLSRALALWRSFLKFNPKSTFIFFCMDSFSYDYLSKIDSDRTIVVSHEKFAPSELKKLRSERSTGEYCWTAKPIALEFILENFADVKWAIYLDADAMFFNGLDEHIESIEPPFLLTPHNFSKNLKKLEKVVGRYNAGFVGIKNTVTGIKVLNGWRRNCLTKCSSKPDTFTYADQKYLNEFEKDSNSKCQPFGLTGVNVAPWNVNNYDLSISSAGSIVIGSEPLIFYHFQGMKLKKNAPSCLYGGNINLKNFVVENIYLPYLQELSKAYQLIREDFKNFESGIEANKRGFKLLKDKTRSLFHPARNLLDIKI